MLANGSLFIHGLFCSGGGTLAIFNEPFSRCNEQILASAEVGFFFLGDCDPIAFCTICVDFPPGGVSVTRIVKLFYSNGEF